MPEEPKDNVESQKLVEQAIDLTRKERFGQALELFEEHIPRLTSGTIPDKRVSVIAFSFYGLCLAKERRRYAEAVEYCNISLKYHMLDPEHRYNLAVVFLERNERAKAVETLNSGLQLRPDDTKIHSVFDQIGRRRPPVIPFLPRSNPVNIWLGKKLRSSRSSD
jgi:tetratricopeptide (TPR) repeat protein